jgi:hypothetical protein
MIGSSGMRVHLKGIHRVRRRLANGAVRDHYYAWRGGPVINATPGTSEFVRLFTEAHASLRQPKAGTLMTMIAEFKASADFKKLAPSSVRSYLAYIKLIEDDLTGHAHSQRSMTSRAREFKAWLLLKPSGQRREGPVAACWSGAFAVRTSRP